MILRMSLVQLTTTDAKTVGEILQQRDALSRARTDNAVHPAPVVATVEPHSEQCASIVHLSNLSEPDARARLHELVAALPHLEPPMPLSLVHKLIGVLSPLVAESNAFTGTDSGAGTSSAHVPTVELDAVHALTALAASGAPVPAAAAPTLYKTMKIDENWTREPIAGLRASHALSPELVRFRGTAWLRIGPSRVCAGRGVFAEREFAGDELILVYDGETCSAERGRVSQHVAKLWGGYFDGYASVGGMLNTSASPNAELRSSGGVWARCAISCGEEVLIPYGRGFSAVHM